MRYLPLSQKAHEEMLDAVGAARIRDLYKDVPESALLDGPVDMPNHKGELEVDRELSAMAAKNRSAADGPFFLGAGVYYHHVPATVDYIIQRSEFLTAYTPYQPEIAQGTLQVVFEFQSFIAQLTGQDIANASLYDGSTACVEAALMAMRITKRRKVAIGTPLHPEYRKVMDSYMGNLGDVEIEDGEPDENTACVIVQSPDFFGNPHAYAEWRKKCNETGAMLVVVVTEIVSLGLLPAPVEADIVCGEGQGIGLAMSYGGPHLGFFACKEKYLRQMPGRICGMTEDADGRRGFVLTLSTREQHIRRDKATSNICTNQGLCALAFTVHMSLLGETGFSQLARVNHEKACALADALENIDGVALENQNFFNEFVITLTKPAKEICDALIGEGIIAGYPLEGDRMLVCATEMVTDKDIEVLAKALRKVL